jgi:UDP-N-acetylglucosamine 2-epimerase
MDRPVLLSLGTRPEVIKMAPVYHALRERGLEPVVLHTGQHEAGVEPDGRTVWPLYEFFDFAPAHRVTLARRRDTLAHLTALLVEAVAAVLADIEPAAVLVHGDTTSTLAAALAAFYARLPLAHVEAGLRTHRAYDPFPEEKNRELVARLATWHFAPTAGAARNLLAEGVPRARIHEVGNTVVDAVRWGVARLQDRPAREILPPVLATLPARLEGRRLVLVTAHRRENWGPNIARIARAVRSLLEEDPGLVAVWPVHPNPRVGATVHAGFERIPPAVAARLLLTPSLAYPAVLWLLERAWLVLTDSGGIQEEAAATHTPVLVLRESTERPELVTAGTGIVVGTDPDRILGQVRALAASPARYQAMRRAPNPFGDGRAAHRIADTLATLLEAPAALAAGGAGR